MGFLDLFISWYTSRVSGFTANKTNLLKCWSTTSHIHAQIGQCTLTGTYFTALVYMYFLLIWSADNLGRGKNQFLVSRSIYHLMNCPSSQTSIPVFAPGWLCHNLFYLHRFHLAFVDTRGQRGSGGWPTVTDRIHCASSPAGEPYGIMARNG